jgi:hypothetical protein
MENIADDLIQIQSRLKLITNFSDHNVIILTAIVHQYSSIISQLQQTNPVNYSTSVDNVNFGISKLDLLTRQDFLTKKNAFNVIRRTLLRSLARDLNHKKH